MKTKKISSAIAKAIGVLWIILLTGVIITYTTSCSSKSGQKHRRLEQYKQQIVRPNIIQIDGFIGTHEYYEIVEAISTVDDMKEWVGQDIENGILPKEYGESYLMWLSSISSDLNDLLFQRIVANN